MHLCRWGRLGSTDRHVAKHELDPEVPSLVGFLSFLCNLSFAIFGWCSAKILYNPTRKVRPLWGFLTFLILCHANFLFFSSSPWFWLVCDWMALNVSLGSSYVGCLRSTVFIHPPVSTQAQWPSGKPNFVSFMLLHSFFWEPPEAIQLSWFDVPESINLALNPPDSHSLPLTGAHLMKLKSNFLLCLPQFPTSAAWQKWGLVIAASKLWECVSLWSCLP